MSASREQAIKNLKSGQKVVLFLFNKLVQKLDDTLRNAAWVAGKIDLSRRRDN